MGAWIGLKQGQLSFCFELFVMDVRSITEIQMVCVAIWIAFL